MPEKSGFFDHTEDDPREYPAREWAEYFGTLITNGVLNGGLNLNVSATGTDANVSISTGIAWIKGYRYSIYDSPLVLPIQPATTQDRIDRIVLRLDTSIAVKRIRALIVQGTPATNPTAPSIVRSGDVFDLSLAQVRVKANSTIILAANITDERLNQSVCGLMNSLIKVDTATFQQQWDAFIASVQNQGFATPSYVNEKALEAEKNAKNASLPKTGGTVSGALKVDGELTFADGSTATQLKQSVSDGKAMLKGTIVTGKGGTVSQAGSTPTFDELDAGIKSIQQGRYLKQTPAINDQVVPTVGWAGQILRTIATFPAGTKLISIIGHGYDYRTNITRNFYGSTYSGEIMTMLALRDSNGVLWELQRNASSYVAFSGNARNVYGLDIDLVGNESNIVLGAEATTRLSTLKPSNFNVNGTMTLVLYCVHAYESNYAYFRMSNVDIISM